jgi:eukaryotic-like serine/threonine-protein kinase
MSFGAGTRMGPYTIQSHIASGGMGAVYRACDERLGRNVAIKVLPDKFAQDTERLRRFEQEARATGILNHPNIVAIYDVGTHDGSPYVVSELLEGETLRDALSRGPIAARKAIEYAAQIAAGLAAAHDKGIIHRDLKPENLFVTLDGRIKILDFGLAKLTEAAEQSWSQLPTAASGPGVALGTVGYMSPEQVRGQSVDSRTDLFTLGIVLHEMLTGQRVFHRDTAVETMSAILRDDPKDLSAVRPDLPPALDRIVRHCLEKNPVERFQSARDVAFALESLSGSDSAVQGTATSIPFRMAAQRRLRISLMMSGGAIGFLLALIMGGLYFRQGAVRPRITRVDMLRLLLSEQHPAQTTDPVRSFAISRDGTRVVYVAEGDGVRRLFLRDMQSIEPRPMAGTDGAATPFFSPDGERVGFVAGGKLKTIALNGGAPLILADSGNARGATWAANDTIIYSPLTDAGLWQVPAAGGTPRLIAEPESGKGERSYRWPEMLPDGDGIVFTLAMSDIVSFDDARLMVRSLRTGEQHEILRGGSFAAYSPAGELLYARAGALFAVPFDIKRRIVTGTPHLTVDGIATYPISGAAQFALSENGTLLYIAGKSETPERALTWVTRDGRATRLPVAAVPYQNVGISPDGTRAALDIDGANASTWILDLGRNAMTRLTLEWSNNLALWTADGSRVAFSSARQGMRSLYWQRVDGQGVAEPVLAGPHAFSTVNAAAFSPDGRLVVFSAIGAETGNDLWIAQLDGDRTARPLLQTRFDEYQPAFAPDGHWLAYVSTETGQPEVYVQPYPGPGRKSRVSFNGGRIPKWSRDGRELFYRNGDAMMAVQVRASASSLELGQPHVLFRKSLSGNYDVAPDGRFLTIEPLQSGLPARPITVVLNWLHPS